ncbi:hypothetical protein PLICBS_007484 [Purpureocillium lilacinum]|uniref:uncharacterized protein n=1 Tax=Purpureocillium lilacinum TaxID=33203 RepID=UPI002086E533|nr:hypothetical protein PLICBS_007484 [Purpureocillium lilacinum]
MSTPFQIEAWTEYGLGLELCMLELIGQYGTNIGVTDDIGATLSSEQIARFEFGSKCLLAGWNFYVSLIWALKGCMLCFFQRITYGAPGSGIIAHDME